MCNTEIHRSEFELSGPPVRRCEAWTFQTLNADPATDVPPERAHAIVSLGGMHVAILITFESDAEAEFVPLFFQTTVHKFCDVAPAQCELDQRDIVGRLVESCPKLSEEAISSVFINSIRSYVAQVPAMLEICCSGQPIDAEQCDQPASRINERIHACLSR